MINPMLYNAGITGRYTEFEFKMILPKSLNLSYRRPIALRFIHLLAFDERNKFIRQKKRFSNVSLDYQILRFLD